MKTLMTAKLLVEHDDTATVDDLKDALNALDVMRAPNLRIESVVVDHMEPVS